MTLAAATTDLREWVADDRNFRPVQGDDYEILRGDDRMPLIVALMVQASTPWFLAVLLLVLAVPVWRSLVASAAERRELAYREGLVTAARADRQHVAVLAGDERGVYGDYPPAVLSGAGVWSDPRSVHSTDGPAPRRPSREGWNGAGC